MNKFVNKLLSLKNKNKTPRKPPEPVDLSELPNKAYPLDVYAVFDKKDTHADITLIMPFQDPKFGHQFIRVPVTRMQLSKIIDPRNIPGQMQPKNNPPGGNKVH